MSRITTFRRTWVPGHFFTFYGGETACQEKLNGLRLWISILTFHSSLSSSISFFIRKMEIIFVSTEDCCENQTYIREI